MDNYSRPEISDLEPMNRLIWSLKRRNGVNIVARSAVITVKISEVTDLTISFWGPLP